MSTPTPADADALPGPDWLRARRRAAAGRAAQLSIPTTAEEVWRYSRVDALDLDLFRLAHEAPGGSGTAPLDQGLDLVVSALGDLGGLVLLRNGAVISCDLDAETERAGVTFRAAGDADESIFGLSGAPLDHFVALNEAFTAGPVVLDVPAGAHIDKPIAVVDWLDEAGVMTFPRLSIRVGPDASATVIEWQGSTDVESFVAPLTEIEVGNAGSVRHVLVQDRGPSVWQIASQSVSVGQQATFSGYQAALGGYYARSRVDCRLDGRGGSGNLSAVYFGTGDQMLDFRTFQDHAAPDTTSNLMFKGAVGGTSRAVYTGLIKVEKEARGTNAFQTNRNLKLSEDAWAESVPNLEIENNDVRCSHASTVGPVDEDQLFYLESRGVPTAKAERLIVAGFFDEVTETIPSPGVVSELRRKIDERLDEMPSIALLTEGAR